MLGAGWCPRRLACDPRATFGRAALIGLAFIQSCLASASVECRSCRLLFGLRCPDEVRRVRPPPRQATRTYYQFHLLFCIRQANDQVHYCAW